MPHTDDGPLPAGRERRNSYLEVSLRPDNFTEATKAIASMPWCPQNAQ